MEVKLKEIEGNEMKEFDEDGDVIYKGEFKIESKLEVVRQGK